MPTHKNRNLPEMLQRGNWNPARELSRLQRGIDRIFDDFFMPGVTSGLSPDLLIGAESQPAFLPACDIEETSDHFKLSFDLPGVSKDDVKIEMRGNQLVVSGERKEEQERQQGSRFSQERYYGSFLRTFTLPTEVDANRIEAAYQDGVLQIALPKSEIARPKQIEIKEKKSGVVHKLTQDKTDKQDKKEEQHAAKKDQRAA